MKKTVLAAAAAMICLNLVADMISLFGSNVEVHARSAASVTGPQAAAIASALQPESTNGWIVAAHQNWLTNETDAAALNALNQFAATVKTTVVTDTFDPSVFTRWENSTGLVYRVTDASHWTENWLYQPEITFPYPLAEYSGGLVTITIDGQYASVLIGAYYATGVPTNSTSFEAYYLESTEPLIVQTNLYEYVFRAETNLVSELSTTAELADARASITGEISAALATSLSSNTLTEARISALRLAPVVSNMYANLAVTNIAGYASFGTANPAAPQTTTVIPASAIATNTVGLRYDIGSDGFISAQAVTYALVGSGIESMSSTLTLWNYLGEPLASNVFYGVWSGSIMFLPYFTNNLVWTGSFLTNAYLTLTCTMSKTDTSSAVCRIAAGGAVPSRLAVTTTPLPYTTPEQLQTAVANVSSGYVPQTGGATNLVLNGVQQTYDEATRTFTGTVEGGSGTTPAQVTNIVAGLATTNRLWYTMPWAGASHVHSWQDGASYTNNQTNTTAFAWIPPSYDNGHPITCRVTQYNNGVAGCGSSNIVCLTLYYASAFNANRIIGSFTNGGNIVTGQWTYKPVSSDSGYYALRVFPVNASTVTNAMMPRLYNDMRWSPATAEEISAAGL